MKAAEQGIAVAQDFANALNWYWQAAEQNNAKAQSNLVFMDGQGLDVARDDFEAAAWYRMAAEQGLAQAQHNLGVIYDQGVGISQNVAEAENWYRKAAAQDHGDSVTILALAESERQDFREGKLKSAPVAAGDDGPGLRIVVAIILVVIALGAIAALVVRRRRRKALGDYDL
ncbi:MAG: tetratricopeptide repeat protein [Alphaproteobacteria bacterium]